MRLHIYYIYYMLILLNANLLHFFNSKYIYELNCYMLYVRYVYFVDTLKPRKYSEIYTKNTDV